MNDIEKKLKALKAEFLGKLEALEKEAEMQKKQNQALESMKETVNSTVNYALKIGDSFGRVKEAIILDRKNWRTETRRILLKIVWKFPTIGTVGSVYNKLYEALESRASVKLDTRLKNLTSSSKKTSPLRWEG